MNEQLWLIERTMIYDNFVCYIFPEWIKLLLNVTSASAIIFALGKWATRSRPDHISYIGDPEIQKSTNMVKVTQEMQGAEKLSRPSGVQG